MTTADRSMERGESTSKECGFTSPVFDLVSFARPPRSRYPHTELDHAGEQCSFRAELDMALRSFIEQLPLGAALVAEHHCEPTSNGAMSIRSRLAVQLPDRLRGDRTIESHLNQELTVCLSILSGHYSFRSIEPDDNTNDLESGLKVGLGQTLLVRPVAVECVPRPANMGFTSVDDVGEAVWLPVFDSVDESASVFRAQGNGGLHHTLKAARAFRHAVCFRIRLTKDRFDTEARKMLARLQKSDLSEFDKKNRSVADDASRASAHGYSSLRNAVSAWSQSNSATILRVELEAQCSEGSVMSNSFLRILASEVFPGQVIEIVSGAGRRGQDSSQKIDFSNAFPLVAGLPPLLPEPSVLEMLSFARHYSNPAVQLPNNGLLLGHAQLSGFEHPVHIATADRSRHMYMLGATGTGKSTLLYNMISRDMLAGEGLAVIDPHGDLFDQVLASVPAQRIRDVVIIDPSDDHFPVGLNPLDFGGEPSLMKVNRIINDLLDIFDDLYNMREAGGPGFEQYFRNTLLLASTAPANSSNGPPTLLTPLEVLRNKDFRDQLLAKCQSSFLGADMAGEVQRFFHSAQATSGEQRMENWVPYITNKLVRFTNNPLLRQMLCFPRRTVDFRRLMDERKIVLVNLSKGEIGSQDTRMLGMLISKYLFQAAMGRADVPRQARAPFYFYVDEFHNFVTSDIPEMLAESRKFGLHMILANQTLSQLVHREGRSRLDAILGNVASRLFFRVGLEDAKTLEADYLPQFDAHTLAQLPDRHVLTRLLVDNKPSLPFVFQTSVQAPFVETLDGIEVADLARRWSRGHYSVSPFASTLPSSEPGGRENSTLVLEGDLAVAHSALVGSKDASEIDLQIRKAMPRWRGAAKSVKLPHVAPEVGVFFRTGNGSLVLVFAIDSDGDGRVLVVSGGHADDESIRGACPGSWYLVKASGHFRSSSPMAALLGMDLHEKVSVEFARTNPFSFAPDSTFGWLLQKTDQAPRALPEQPSGFFRTLNGSLVFVSFDGDKPSLRATVCNGGHGVEELNGTKKGERYVLTRGGQFLVPAEKARSLSTSSLALASGMSLAEPWPMIGDELEDFRDSREDRMAR